MAQSTPLRKGESVRVKPEVMCPDYERLSLAGWQGRVFEVQQEDDGRATIGIQWDSITLAGLPEDYLADCGENGCEGVDMYLDADEVERAEARDTEKAARARAEIVRMMSGSSLRRGRLTSHGSWPFRLPPRCPSLKSVDRSMRAMKSKYWLSRVLTTPWEYS